MTEEFIYKRNYKYYIFDIILIALTVLNITGFGIDLKYYGLKWPIFGYVVFSVIYLALFILGRALFKFDRFLSIALIIFNVFELPILLYLYGANTLVYLLVGIVALIVCLKKKFKWIMTSIVLLLDFAIMIYSYSHHQTLIKEIISSADLINSRYKNIVADVSYFITVFVLIAVSEILLRRYSKMIQVNTTLKETISTLSKRDSLTRLFNKAFIDEYIKNLIESERGFGAVVYKISSFNGLSDKYGAEYNDVLIVGLSELIMNEAVERAVIGRYSKSTFILIFSDKDKMNDTINNIDMKIDSGIFSNINILKGEESIKKDDTKDTFLQRLSNRVKGYGDMCENRDIL